MVSTATSPEMPLRSRGRKKWVIAFLVAVLIIGVLNWIGTTYNGTMVVGFHLWQIFTICGILLFSGLMSGLSGFGFSAVGAVCLLLIPPKLAVPLLMALSTANQFMSIGQLKEDMPKSVAEARTARFVAAADTLHFASLFASHWKQSPYPSGSRRLICFIPYGATCGFVTSTPFVRNSS